MNKLPEDPMSSGEGSTEDVSPRTDRCVLWSKNAVDFRRDLVVHDRPVVFAHDVDSELLQDPVRQSSIYVEAEGEEAQGWRK